MPEELTLESTPSTAEAIERLTRESVHARRVSDTAGLYTLVTASDHTVTVLDLDAIGEEGPRRKTGSAGFVDTAGFCAYVERHAEPGCTLWADRAEHKIVAVLNDDEQIDPGYRDHRAYLNLEYSPEAKAILGLRGATFGQDTFAEWLEQWTPLIARPEAATIMEIVLTLEQSTKVEWRSAVRLADGQRQLQYQETIATKAGQAGTLTVPDEIVFVAPIFRDTATHAPITGKLRYRVADNKLQISVVLVRPETWIDDALALVTDMITETTAIPVWHGTPPKARLADELIYTTGDGNR